MQVPYTERRSSKAGVLPNHCWDLWLPIFYHTGTNPHRQLLVYISMPINAHCRLIVKRSLLVQSGNKGASDSGVIIIILYVLSSSCMSQQFEGNKYGKLAILTQI